MADFSFLRFQDEGGIYRVERFDGEPLKVYLTSEEIAIEEAEQYLELARNPELERATRPQDEENNELD
jgi:hypothetical protein